MITTVQCSICSQLNNKHRVVDKQRVVVTNRGFPKLRHTKLIVIVTPCRHFDWGHRYIVTMPHNCCVPLCRKKGYRTVTISGKQAKVTYHKFPSESNRSKRKQWIRAIRRDVGKHFKPGKWTKICSLHFKETDFYNFWGGYRTLREDSVPSIFDFDSGRTEKSSSRVSRRSRCRPCPPSVSEAVDESGASEAVDGSGAREDGNGSDASEGGDRSHGTCISDQSLSHAPDQSPSSLASDLSPSSLAPDPSTASLAPDLSSSSLPPDPSTASLTHQSPLPIQESMVVLKAENDALRKRLNELESGKIELVRELELAERRT